MAAVLHSPFVQLTLHPNPLSWDLLPFSGRFPAFSGLSVQIDYLRGPAASGLASRRLHLRSSTSNSGRCATVQTVESQHGRLQTCVWSADPDPNGLQLEMHFAAPQALPAAFWRARLVNTASHPLIVDRLVLLDASTRQPRPGARGGRLLDIDPTAAAFFANGWQSWSYSGVYHPGDRFRRTRLGPVRAPADYNPGTPRPWRKGRFAADMFGVLADHSGRRATLLGFLSQRRGFGSLAARLDSNRVDVQLWANGDRARLAPGAELLTDWACAFLIDMDDPDPLGPYLQAAAQDSTPEWSIAARGRVRRTRGSTSTGSMDGTGERHGAALPGEKSDIGSQSSGQAPSTPVHASTARIPSGWCSWYQFSTDDLLAGTVTAADVRANLAAILELRSELPLDVIQIDDGWQAQVGDWLRFSPAFPDGVAPLAEEISAAGFTPGLWLAPFIVHPQSRLAIEHPDWIVRTRSGRAANAGFFWNRFAAGLDLTHPQVLEYVHRVIRTAVGEWGFRYLKLDFLYAGALSGSRCDPEQTRAQALRAALEVIRLAAGAETFLVGCSCPLGPAIGMVDAMRIGADTAKRWKPAVNNIEKFFAAEPGLPSARNACHNSLTRAALHRSWWVNDPDCLLVRPQTRLTLPEIQTVATVIALTGGSLLLSDNLPGLPLDRRRIAQCLLPPIGRRPQTPDVWDRSTPAHLQLDLENAAGGWRLVALFNWEDHPRRLELPRSETSFTEKAGSLAHEFWTGRLEELPGGDGAKSVWPVPAHGVALLAIRPIDNDRPQFIGSDLHISQGLEVEAWDWDAAAGRLDAVLRRPGYARGQALIRLPGALQRAQLNEHPLEWTEEGAQCLRFSLEFDDPGRLTLWL